MKSKIDLPKLISFFKRLFNIVLTGFVIIVLVGLVLPSKWEVKRSQVMNATPAQIYPYISNFKTGWGQWSAFEMGNGILTITKTVAQRSVEFRLHMIPDHFSTSGEIKLEPLQQGTKVIWINRGEMGSNIFFKYMGLMMDKEFGKPIEESLSNLKKLVEPKTSLPK